MDITAHFCSTLSLALEALEEAQTCTWAKGPPGKALEFTQVWPKEVQHLGQCQLTWMCKRATWRFSSFIGSSVLSSSCSLVMDKPQFSTLYSVSEIFTVWKTDQEDENYLCCEEAAENILAWNEMESMCTMTKGFEEESRDIIMLRKHGRNEPKTDVRWKGK